MIWTETLWRGHNLTSFIAEHQTSPSLAFPAEKQIPKASPLQPAPGKIKKHCFPTSGSAIQTRKRTSCLLKDLSWRKRGTSKQPATGTDKSTDSGLRGKPCKQQQKLNSGIKKKKKQTAGFCPTQITDVSLIPRNTRKETKQPLKAKTQSCSSTCGIYSEKPLSCPK